MCLSVSPTLVSCIVKLHIDLLYIRHAHISTTDGGQEESPAIFVVCMFRSLTVYLAHQQSVLLASFKLFRIYEDHA